MTNPNPEGLPSLKPCPFCGNHAEVSEVKRIPSKRRWVGECLACLACTGYEMTPGDAVKSWNRRENTHTDALGAALEKVLKAVTVKRSSTSEVERAMREDIANTARAALEAWRNRT